MWEFTRWSQRPLKQFGIWCAWEVILGKSCLRNPWSNGSDVWEFTRTSQNPLKYFCMCCPWEVPFWRDLVLEPLEALAAMFENLQEHLKTHWTNSPYCVYERSHAGKTLSYKTLKQWQPMFENIQEHLKTHLTNSVCVVHERSHSGETLKQWQPCLRVYKKISKATQTVQYVLSVRGHSGDTWKQWQLLHKYSSKRPRIHET